MSTATLQECDIDVDCNVVNSCREKKTRQKVGTLRPPVCAPPYQFWGYEAGHQRVGLWGLLLHGRDLVEKIYVIYIILIYK